MPADIDVGIMSGCGTNGGSNGESAPSYHAGSQRTPPKMMTQSSSEAVGSPLEELRKVEPLINQALVAGGTYYLVNRKWYVEWKQWVGHPEMQSPKMRPMPDPCLSQDYNYSVSPNAGPPPDLTNFALESASNAPKRTRTHSWTKDRPGPIDNSDLFEEAGLQTLKKAISEHVDYCIVPEEAWTMLSHWYGGGPTIKRRAVKAPSGRNVLELHKQSLKIYVSSDINTTTPMHFNEFKCTLVKDFKTSICYKKGRDPLKVRIWDYFNRERSKSLEDYLDKTLEESMINDDQPILLEEQNADGTWPYDQPVRTGYSDANTGSYGSNGATTFTAFGYGDSNGLADRPSQQGVVGLQNLGNTCFMNSALQCLSNVPELREFFINDEHEANLNRMAYKTGGKLAEAFSTLMKQMWSGDSSKVAPRDFKWQVGQFAEQFSGYGQQDSMELIEYVLDGLKEDCNKVQGPKPYIEVKEADGRKDAEVAAEALNNYRQRSDSLVDDQFVGLFKSVVKCPETSDGCGRASVTFDPFLSAKLPLTSSSEQRLATYSLTIVRTGPGGGGEGNKGSHIKVQVTVNKDQNVMTLVGAAAAEVPGLKPENCVLVEIYNKRIYKWFEETEAICTIRPEEILTLYEVEDVRAFQVPYQQRWIGTQTPNVELADHRGAIFYHRQKDPIGPGNVLLGLPMVMCVPRCSKAKGLYTQVERRLREILHSDPNLRLPSWKIWRIAKGCEARGGEELKPDDETTLTLTETHEFFSIEWAAHEDFPETLNFSDARTGCNVDASTEREQDLAHLLQMFVEQERLSADDAWYCNKCKEPKQAWKKLEFHRTPPTLVLQLKRFQYERWSRERLNTPVKFPLEGLDLSPYCTESSRRGENSNSEKTMYDLVGVSNHIGGLGGGHYTAYCRSSLDGEWYEFNDSIARRISKDEVENDKVGAYVLFYLRRDRRPTAFGRPVRPATQ